MSKNLSFVGFKSKICLRAFASEAKYNLPNARVEMVTNGDVLNINRLKKIFKAGLDQAKTELIKGDKTKKDFEIFMYNLEDNFYNWSRFFGTESGAGNFLRRNGMFLINFVLLGVIFIYRLNNNIKITPSYLEVFIIVCVFNVILFIYHRCADYHSSCKIFGWSGSNAFAFILFIGLGAYLAILIKKNIDNKKKKEIK